ncbi:hypothetical protein BJ742DRAFT_735026 [Cladochytrium replicatum]|nr:hypothetical protein BJ742DRAFT_735026 [Cladochytrium replicatum]
MPKLAKQPTNKTSKQGINEEQRKVIVGLNNTTNLNECAATCKGYLKASKKEVFQAFSHKEDQTLDAFMDVLLDFSHLRPTVAILEFPKQWLQTPPGGRKGSSA